MSRRLLVAATFVLFAFTCVRSASAQAPVTNVQLDLMPMVARGLAAPAPAAKLETAARQTFSTSRASLADARPHASMVMPALYATTFAMQMMDVRSTLTAFSNGATEQNPLMTGITKNKAGFIAFKAGIATAAMMSAHEMAKHSKVRAIVTLAVINSAYAMVVAHNYQVARSLR